MKICLNAIFSFVSPVSVNTCERGKGSILDPFLLFIPSMFCSSPCRKGINKSIKFREAS
uniref:ORF58b n=1 Tax=Pinus koraiensis TaxID=88728 RepID=A4QM54_PINKO|nr:ORF58b [Pinus koraiensis]